jgi:ABC-type transporter Mla subunit MlaD
MAINTQAIREIERSIRTHTDCQSLLFTIEVAINQQIKQLESTIASSAKLNNLFAALTTIPTTIDQIIDAFKKSIIGQAIENLKAAVDQAKQIIEFADALSDLVDAIADAAERLPDCFAQAPEILEYSLKQSIDNNINGIVGPALQKVRDNANLINNAIPGIIYIDTSDAQAFMESIRDNPINTENIVYAYEKIFSRD